MSPETTVRYFEFDAAKAGPWVPAAAALLVQSSVDVDVEAVTLIGVTPDALGTVTSGSSDTYATSHAFVRLVSAGAGTASIAASMPVSAGGGGGGGGGAVTIADGADLTQGAKSQTAATSDAGSWSIVQLIKRGLGNWTALLARIPDSVGSRIPVDGSGVTQPVSAGALPLPAGASTAAKQDTLLAALLVTPSDITLDSAGTAFSPASCSHVYSYDGSNNLTTDIATDGAVVRVKTLTYTSGNLTAETKWVVQ